MTHRNDLGEKVVNPSHVTVALIPPPPPTPAPPPLQSTDANDELATQSHPVHASDTYNESSVLSVQNRLSTLSKCCIKFVLLTCITAFEFRVPYGTPSSSTSRSPRMRYVVAWAYVPRPVLSTSFVFLPTARLIAMAHPEAVDDEKAFELTQTWLRSKAARGGHNAKISVVTGIHITADPANLLLPSGIECTTCRQTNTRLASIKSGKDGNPDVHTWHCMNQVNAFRNSAFPCEGCIVCHHSVDLWDHLYHHCEVMRAAGVPAIFLSPNYEDQKRKHGVCVYCNWGPTNVFCKCK